MSISADMLLFSARLDTFERPQPLTKRRASSQSTRRRNGSTVEWPHAKPTPEELARAGFFYKPSQESQDNVQCFMCAVKLDGWEADDDAASEHLAHSQECAWAIAMSVAPRVQGPQESRDPMCEELVAARTTTFTIGEGWVHEKKKGWKCKTKKMVAAGWCHDPAQLDVEDSVICFYCGIGLDGWEPKDDPSEEHRKRAPDCPFFALTAQYGSSTGVKAKGKGKGRTKGSNASTTSSRISTQSAMSMFSDPPSLAGIGDDLPTADDSIMTAATNASSATTKAANKKAPRAKTTTKAGRGKKQSSVPPERGETDVQYPILPNAAQDDPMDLNEMPDMPVAKAARKAKTTRSSQQPIDSSVVEVSSLESVPNKTSRARKPKLQQEQRVQTPEPEDYNKRNSQASAQLLDELEQSLIEPDHEATPQAIKPKRGTKRTSDGMPKEQDSSAAGIEAPVKKTAKGGKAKAVPSSQTEDAPEALLFSPNTSITEYPWVTGQFPPSESELDQVKKGAKGQKVGSQKVKAKKTSSARSSKATVVVADPESLDLDDEDLARDEAEIEAELERIAAEAKAAEEAVRAKVVTREADDAGEFEPSPTRPHQPAQQTDDNERESTASPQKSMTNATPSPTGSDKENNPSVLQLSAKPPAPIYTSPTKTTRIPLATSTPNVSPRKLAAMTPSRQISGLASTKPWQAADLESILLASPQPTPGSLGQRLANMAGNLTSPEKQMTVEEWVRHLAGEKEEAMRSKCEELLAVLERQGMQAMQSLEGIVSV